jgi:predicted DNA-binding transcriptional regulator AlpA
MTRLATVAAVTASDLLAEPARIDEIPPEVIPALLAQLSAAQSALVARWLAIGGGAPTAGSGAPVPDTLLTAEDTAKRLGVSEDWVYRHAATLPFTVRLSGGALRFSSHGLDDFIRRRRGRA